MSDLEDFDPFQVFEVEHRPCLLLHVTVVRGRNISKGWVGDLLDTPDPYVLLRMKTAPEGRRQSRHVDNDVNPEWNETFTFFLDSNLSKSNILQIHLMDANYAYDETIGTAYFNVNQLVLNETKKHTIFFNETSEVDLEMKIEFDTQPTLRYSLCLSNEEKKFRHLRRSKILINMQKMLGKQGPRDLKEVPTIGLLGSGGGFRAMVGMSGVFKALWDSGILDCAMYTASLSGSSWYVSQLYSHPEWPHISPGGQIEELKNNIDSSLLWLMKPQSVYRYLDRILQKRREGQPVSFTDFFGHLVGETLLKGRLGVKLTDQQDKLREGTVPMPMYTCVHVKKDVSAKVFQEWVEFSPYEIGMPKYGTFMKTHHFGSKFFLGRICKHFEEPPLHFLQGIWGSAFCILFKRLLAKGSNNKLDPVELVRIEMAKELDDNNNKEDPDSDSSDSETEDPATAEPEPATKRRKTRHDNAAKPTLVKQKSSQRTKQKGFWEDFLGGLFTTASSSWSLLSTRVGRAGVIHNPLRGLLLQRTYPFSPFTPMAPVTSQDEFRSIFEMHPTDVKRLYMVDAGLTFNSPYPLLLRPQRAVNILLSFDFSARPTDISPPFKELLLAAKWAKLNNVAFPPIDVSVYQREGMKELYIFKHPTDPHCPVVFHFVLVNLKFRQYTKPGVARTTDEEVRFANFDLFDDPDSPYSTFNFKYSHEQFDRLSQLMEFNTLLHIDDIKAAIGGAIERRRTLGLRPPLQCNKVGLILPQIKSRANRKKLRLYFKRIGSMASATSDDNFSSCDSDSDSDDVYQTPMAEPCGNVFSEEEC